MSKPVSYNESLGFFTGDLFAEKYSVLCKSLRLDSNTLPLCSALEGEGVNPDSHVSEMVKGANFSNNLKPFSVNSFNEEIHPDLHKISMPWITAIFQLGRNANRKFLTALLSPSKREYQSLLTCGFKDQTETSFEISAPNFLSFITDFTTKLDSHEASRWNSLKKSNRLSLSKGLLFRETNRPLTFQVYDSVSNDSNMRKILAKHPYCKNGMEMVGDNCTFNCQTVSSN